jgi:hypothetical protein
MPAMDRTWKSAFIRSYAAVLDQLEQSITACPQDLWEESLWEVKKEHPNVWPVKRAGEKKRPPKAEQDRLLQVHSAFWNVAYHALFHVDFYVSGAQRKGFGPPPPFREDDHHGNVVPARTYDRAELQHYVGFNREKVRATIDALTQADVDRIVPRAAVPFGEFMLSNILHTQEHAAQLGLFLSQRAIEPGGGVARAQNVRLLRNGVRSRTDAEIDRFAKLVGGYPRLLPLVFAGYCANIDPRGPANVAFDLGTTYVVKVLPGAPATFEAGSAPDVEATLHISPQDFLRLMVSDLVFEDALAAGRTTIDGDTTAVARLFAQSAAR